MKAICTLSSESFNCAYEADSSIRTEYDFHPRVTNLWSHINFKPTVHIGPSAFRNRHLEHSLSETQKNSHIFTSTAQLCIGSSHGTHSFDLCI